MADGGILIIIGAAIAVSVIIAAIYWIDRVAEQPRDIYEPPAPQETAEQRFRKAGEQGYD